MKKYLYGSQIVEAARIIAITSGPGAYDMKYGVMLEAPNGTARVSPEWMKQHSPKVNDYLIHAERKDQAPAVYVVSLEALNANYTPLDAVKVATVGQPTEAELQSRAVAPRVTASDIDAAIKAHEYHVFSDSCLTVCCITLQNGYTVTGESACAAPENFQKDIGERFAFESAKRKIGPLLGFMLRQRLFERGHTSDCATNNEPAYPAGECDCEGRN